MSLRVGVIGMGWVGSSVAISTLHRGLVAELLVNDIRSEIAEGEAMDLCFRLRACSARHVVGEHGDSEICLWSTATVAGCGLRDWPGWSEAKEDTIAERVRVAAYEIIRRKGATNHAIGLVTAAVLSAVLGDERRVLTVSTVQQGALDSRDVALSLPSVIGREGVRSVL